MIDWFPPFFSFPVPLCEVSSHRRGWKWRGQSSYYYKTTEDKGKGKQLIGLMPPLFIRFLWIRVIWSRGWGEEMYPPLMERWQMAKR